MRLQFGTQLPLRVLINYKKSNGVVPNLALWFNFPILLNALELSTFKSRRDRGDLIQLLRYFKGFENINLSNAPKFSNAITRGHRLKFVQESCHHYSRNCFIFNRIAFK